MTTDTARLDSTIRARVLADAAQVAERFKRQALGCAARGELDLAHRLHAGWLEAAQLALEDAHSRYDGAGSFGRRAIERAASALAEAEKWRMR